MYKIYVNETKLLLMPSSALEPEHVNSKDQLISAYSGKIKSLFNFLDMFEKGGRIKLCVLHFPDYERLLADFKSVYRVVSAGGGLVLNERNEILFIHRRGSWDLPKGKLDKGETNQEAAIREVEEETGVKGLKIIRKMIVTRHTYKDKKRQRCIKKSHWYLMSCPDQKLTPQAEEGIKNAKWMTIEEFNRKERKVYRSIRDVLQSYIDQR